MLDTTWRTFTMSMNVDGFIRHNRFPHDYEGVFERDDGTPLSAAEARTFLAIEKSKGHKVIPCSSSCGNPCAHARDGCTGFDFSGGGCPGRMRPQLKTCISCGAQHEFHADNTPVGGALPCGH